MPRGPEFYFSVRKKFETNFLKTFFGSALDNLFLIVFIVSLVLERLSYCQLPFQFFGKGS